MMLPLLYRKDHITINNFGLREQDMLLHGIDGVASRSEADNVRVFLKHRTGQYSRCLQHL